ncbi:uncharacterized protein LOC104584761 [Brachypodium distachyon]|uniref:Uncharacterized protein n=1 Tax=Brachypodium distachyon TaxID=15368 RepID=I1ITV3_BRADI|nr:uncharacterized protein LOC104584761 [Brachypodium distachyon]KQJ91985.1 hypothetical protein BRADI_4g40980v3 [Brachypodium distachyon]|eukprot:XP_010238649.1 uncharacterized protein LOC104584761 [Brachypodium distachyon]
MGEEFTFPSCTQPEQRGGASKSLAFPQFASPPPWFFVSVPGADEDRHRRCFSAVEKPTKVTNKDDGYYYIHGGGGSERFAMAEEQHKMDMLWEDFNEELARAPPPCPLSKEWASEAWLPGDEARAATRHAVVVPGSGGVVRRRRLSLLVMLKLLRKLFLARKSTSRKTPPT